MASPNRQFSPANRQSPIANWQYWALFTATLAVYWPALHGRLLWNDSDYVTRPELQSLHGLWRIWTELGATEQYYPLLHSFFWLQHRLWADNPLGYHVINVLLHATSACVLAAVVRQLLAGARLSGGIARQARSYNPDTAAWIAAALFALHPVMVESVAWISEQKNTLSTVFYLWAALVYLRNESSSRRTYVFASLLFVCALLSKTVTATLPAALLVVAWWQRGRIERRDLMPLIPWLIAGGGFGLFSAWVERNYIGAKGADFALSLLERGLLAGHIVWFYLGKLAWPVNLIFIYPRWQVSAADVLQWLFPLGALALAAVLFALRHRTRAPLAAYLIFLGTLFPTIGFFNVYAFQFSFVADHWLYLPSIALIVLAAGAITHLADRLPRRSLAKAGRPDGLTARPAIGAVVLLALALLGTQSFRQTRPYSDLENFYRTMLARNPDAWMAHNNLGLLLAEANRIPEALESFNTALRLKPTFEEAENNLGVVLVSQQHPTEALAHFRKAVELRPSFARARYHLAGVLRDSGKLSEAIAELQETVRLQPDAAEAFFELGDALLEQGRVDDAIAALEKAVRAQPGYADATTALVGAHGRAGTALASKGEFAAAVPHFAEAIRLGPPRAGAHFNLGLALAQAGRVGESVAEFREAVRLDPADQNARSALARALAETGLK